MQKPRARRIPGTSLALAITLVWGIAQAQQRRPDVVYVPTPHHVVAEMLRVAGVTKDDVVYDLGCGDGRVVIAAAEHFGARGVGVDIDPERIRESRANASRAGVSGQVTFLQQDLFTTDIRDATVVSLYLLHRLNVRLRSKLLSDLRPGTRVVSHAFTMEDWQADQVLRIPGPSTDHTVYYWVIPARVAGRWQWSAPAGERPYTLWLQQRFQKVDGSIRVDDAETPIVDATLVGDRLRFSAATTVAGQRTTLSFDGRVDGDAVEGHVRMMNGASTELHPWTAYRQAADVGTPPKP